MGAGFVRAFLERGETVRVWNRTPGKARELEADGATAFDDPAEAARECKRVHLSLSDDAAVDDVLERARPSIGGATTIVDHTTTAPTPTRERFERWHDRGVGYQHAPVFMGPQNAREHTGLMLASGPTDIFERLRPELERMTGKVMYLGDRVDRAAAFKLFGNSMLFFITSGLADVYAFAKSVGIEAADAQTLFETFKPGNAIDARGKRMAQGDFSPQFELTMARKDVRLVLEEAERNGARLAVLPAIAARFDAVIAAGHGQDDMGAVAFESVPAHSHA